MVWAGVIAAVLVIAIVVTVLCWPAASRPLPPARSLQVWAFPQHGETSGLDANGDAMAKEVFDQVLLFAHVKLRNQSKVPLLIAEVCWPICGRPTEIPLSVSAGNIAQYQEALLAYPQMAAPQGKPLPPHLTIKPGESLEGNSSGSFR